MGVFPYLFINAENGVIQRQVEELANVELGDEGYRLFSYADGLYWSVITAGSIGYGDITPYTTTGKIMAGLLGTMGVITASCSNGSRHATWIRCWCRRNDRGLALHRLAGAGVSGTIALSSTIVSTDAT
jgi:hypothetical protein